MPGARRWSELSDAHRHDDDHDDDHVVLPAGDGPLLRRGGVLQWRRSRLRFFGVVSAGHDLQRDDVQLHWPRDPLRRPQPERWVMQLLQVGHLPAGDDVRRRPERRVRLGLRMPMSHPVVACSRVVPCIERSGGKTTSRLEWSGSW